MLRFINLTHIIFIETTSEKTLRALYNYVIDGFSNKGGGYL